MYLRLTRFLFPLVITIVVIELGGQALSAGMARMPQATETLAAFGLAYALVLALASPLGQSRQMSLVLVDSRASLGKSLRFILVTSLVMTALQLSIALTPLGAWVIEGLHQVDGEMGDRVRLVLLCLAPLPLLRSLSLFLSGLLTRARRTDLISYATLGSVGLGMATVLGLLPVAAIQQQPIWLPILAMYASTVAELGVMLWGAVRYVGPTMPANTAQGRGFDLTYGYIFAFVWPLALLFFVQEFSRPLINLFLAREVNGEQALAVITVVYALGQWPYRWLNEIKNMPTAFQHEESSLVHLRRFTLACGLLSLGISLLLFWTPIRHVLLTNLIGVSPEFALLCVAPLMIFAPFSPVVMVRSYLHGMALLERRTRSLALSGPSRLAAIFVALLVLPWLGLSGAILGVSALLAGFTVETMAVWWGLRGWDWLKARRVQATTSSIWE